MRTHGLHVALAVALLGNASPAQSGVLIIGDPPPWFGPHCVGGSRDGASCATPRGGITTTGTPPLEMPEECPDGGMCTMLTGPPDPPPDWLGESADVVTPTSGTATLIYVHPDRADRIAGIGAFLRSRDWVDRVIGPDELAAVGQAARHGLVFAISLKSDDQPNKFGIRGRSVEARPAAGKADHLGCGQHGGLARYEQMPFLMIEGRGFTAGTVTNVPTSPIDLAPTILAHLDQPATGMDGRALQVARAQ